MKAPLLLSLSATLMLAALLSACRTSPHDGTVELFDGKSLDGWSHVLEDASVKPENVWSVKDGILTCKGAPIGFIYKGPSVGDFRLLVEYRWAPGGQPGNSGIFSRLHGAMKPLPKTVEVQLQHGNAGDLLGLQGRTISSGQPRFFSISAHPQAGDIAGVRKTTAAENPPGEWNRVEIEATGPIYRVWLNGKLVNEVVGVEQVSGPIGLQSEGGVIEFRRVALTPLH